MERDLPMFFSECPQYRRWPWHFPDEAMLWPTRLERAKMNVAACMVLDLFIVVGKGGKVGA